MRSRTILVIEDDTRIAEWLKIYFERAAFGTEVAHDGVAGLELARSLAPDLIVLDLMLPRLDGVALCRILRRESVVPIIMLTAGGTPCSEARCYPPFVLKTPEQIRDLMRH